MQSKISAGCGLCDKVGQRTTSACRCDRPRQRATVRSCPRWSSGILGKSHRSGRLELDTAVRHNIAILVVVSLNGGWTAGYPTGRNIQPRRNLGYTCVEAKRAIAVDDDDLLVGLSDLRSNSERQPDAYSAERSGIEAMARRKGRH